MEQEINGIEVRQTVLHKVMSGTWKWPTVTLMVSNDRASKVYTHANARKNGLKQTNDYADQPIVILGQRLNIMISKNHARFELSQLCHRRNGREHEVSIFELIGCVRT